MHRSQASVSRRRFLLSSAAALAVTGGGAIMSACGTPATPSAAPTSAASAAPTPTVSSGPSPTTETQASPAAKAAPSGEPVQIVFGTWFTDGTEPILPLIKQFEEQHGVTVKYENIPRDQIMTKFTATFVAGTAPDVQNGDNFSWSKFYDAGYILDLTSYLQTDGIDLRSQYSLIGTEIWCGKHYAMPYQLGTREVFYNKTMIREAGAPDPWDDLNGQWTLDDMLQIATMVTKDTDGDGRLDQWGIHMTYMSIPEVMGMFIWTLGGTWADFNAMKYTLDSPESLEAHRFVHDWVVNKKVVISTEESQELSQLGVGNPFTGGKVAMWVRATPSILQVQREAGDRFEWDVAPFPGKTKEQPGVTLVSGNPHTVHAKTKYPDQSYELVKFLAGPEVQKFFAESKIELPARREFQATFSQDDNRHIHVFTDALEIPYGIHFRHYNTVQHYRQYTDALQQVYLQQQDMAETLSRINRELNDTIAYGDCLPYQGWTVPVQP